MNKKFLLQYGIIFLLVYITMRLFFSPSAEINNENENFTISTINKEFAKNDIVAVKIKNNTEHEAVIKNNCPQEPLETFKKIGGKWEKLTATTTINCVEQKDTIIQPNKEAIIRFDSWNHELFNELGFYKIEASISVPKNESLSSTIESNEFEVKPMGIFKTVWEIGFYQPIYNSLIFIVKTIPNHDLGFAIIILTIIIRTILLIPSQKALKSQRKMNELQPKLNKIKEKYKDNQEMIAKETMALWQQNKVNPFGSCLPLLIQFPFLIAIFYVIQNGLNPNNSYLLYSFLKDFSISDISTNFLGILELTKINIFVLPLIVGSLQFLQMKLAMARNQKKKEKSKKDKDIKTKNTEMEMANIMMTYIMPVMIAVFTASVPAGVGLYWSTSTTYGIVQQIIVNKTVTKEDVKVKVISKK